jgi:TctA family transporter
MAEQYFLTSMVSHGNDVTIFVTRPVSAVVLLLSFLLVAWPLVKRRKARAG